MTTEGRRPPIVFHPAADPFGRTAPLVERATFPVLGVPLEIRSNAAAVLALADAAFGAWRRLDPALVEPERTARLDVIVHPDGGADAPLPPALTLRRHGPVFVAGAGANLFVTLLDRAHALAFVTPAALEDRAWADWHVLAWGRFAASLADRVPIHAAAVIEGGTAVLLLGPSGAGKSTLCYACARAGLPVLSEEVMHVGLARGLRLWGHARTITLDPGASRWFGELRGTAATVRPDGTTCLAVPVPPPAPLTHQGPLVLCVLDRRAGAGPGLVPMPPPASPEAFFGADPGFDQMPDEFPRAAAALLAHPIVRLQLGAADPTAAVDLVREAARAGRVPAE